MSANVIQSTKLQYILWIVVLVSNLLSTADALPDQEMATASRAELLLRNIEIVDTDLEPLRQALPGILRIGFFGQDSLNLKGLTSDFDSLPSQTTPSTVTLVLDVYIARFGEKIRLDYQLMGSSDQGHSLRDFIVFAEETAIISLADFSKKITEEILSKFLRQPHTVVLAANSEFKAQGKDPYGLATMIPTAIDLDLHEYVDINLAVYLHEQASSDEDDESDFFVSGTYIELENLHRIEVSVRDRKEFVLPFEVEGEDPFDLIAPILQRIGEVVEARTNDDGTLRELPATLEGYKDTSELLETAKILIDKDRDDEGALFLRLAIQRGSSEEEAQARTALGNLYYQKRKFDGAIVEYRIVTDLEPGNIEARLQLAQSLQSLNRFEEAQNEYKKTLELADLSLDQRLTVNLRLGEINSLLRQHDKAIFYYQAALQLDRNNVRAIRSLSDYYLESGNETEAIKVLQEAQRRNKNIPEINNQLAELNLRAAKDWLRQMEYYKAENDSLEIADDEDIVQSLRSRAYEIAAAAIVANTDDPDTQQAISYLKSAVELDDKNFEAQMELARLYKGEARYQEALESVNKALELRPGTGLYVERAELFRLMNQLTLALSSALDARRSDPLARDARAELARIYRLLNKYNEALKELDWVLKLYPQDEEAIEMRKDLIGDQQRYASGGNTQPSAVEESLIINDEDLSKKELYSANYKDALLSKSNFSYSQLGFADFTGASFDDIDLSFTELSNAILLDSRLTGTRLTESRMLMTDFRNAWICNSNLENTDANLATFGGAFIDRVSFNDSNLQQANFYGATMTNTSFKNTRLYKTDFSELKFENLNFEDTAWWLAYGWSPEQVRRLSKKFPPKEYLRSSRYKKSIEEKMQAVQNAPSEMERAIALNDLAWERAIQRGDLDQALSEVTEALDLESGNDPDALDTRAQIYLQMNKLDKARVDLDKAFGISPGSIPDPEEYSFSHLRPYLFFRYGLILDYQGNKEQAAHLYQAAIDYGYRPYHEVLTKPPKSWPKNLHAQIAKNPDQEMERNRAHAEFKNWCAEN